MVVPRVLGARRRSRGGAGRSGDRTLPVVERGNNDLGGHGCRVVHRTLPPSIACIRWSGALPGVERGRVHASRCRRHAAAEPRVARVPDEALAPCRGCAGIFASLTATCARTSSPAGDGVRMPGERVRFAQSKLFSAHRCLPRPLLAALARCCSRCFDRSGRHAEVSRNQCVDWNCTRFASTDPSSIRPMRLQQARSRRLPRFRGRPVRGVEGVVWSSCPPEAEWWSSAVAGSQHDGASQKGAPRAGVSHAADASVQS
jgi:hypothetical protein